MSVKVNNERCLIKTIRKRQKNWIGHVLRGDGLLRDVIEERVKGKKRSGKPRKGMIIVLKEAFGKNKDNKGSLENCQNKGRRERSDGYVKMEDGRG